MKYSNGAYLAWPQPEKLSLQPVCRSLWPLYALAILFIHITHTNLLIDLITSTNWAIFYCLLNILNLIHNVE